MNNISCSTKAEFEKHLSDINNKKNTRIFINYEETNDLKEIVSIYNHYLSSQNSPIKKVVLNIRVHIGDNDDYQRFLLYFGEENGNKLRSIFENVEFSFNIALNAKSDISLLIKYQNYIISEFGNSCTGMSVRINGINNLSNAIILNHNMTEFQDLIRENTNIFKNNHYKNKYIVLNVDVSKEGFNLNKLHNNSLICCKYHTAVKGFILNVKGDISRIKPYVQNIISDNIFVICNGVLIVADVDSIGKLPPAIFLNENDFRFFKTPLSKELWNFVVGDIPISAKTLDGFCEIRYWPYLRMCQKFLIEDFDNNKSIKYTLLRKIAYSRESFFNEYVNNMPFLALCIFSIYDNSFRNNLLKKAKKYYNKTYLKYEDLLLSEQKHQNWDDYVRYRKGKRSYDIKNLFSYDENSEIHKTVISEIFECITIAEGLLQILENAVLHANGGLLSMRIYSREQGIETETHKKEHHVRYLNDTYTKEYFDFKNVNFYLEIYISDLSKKSIPDKFVENLLSPENKNNYDKLERTYRCIYGSNFDVFSHIKKLFSKKNIMEYFFGNSLDDELKEFRQMYYSIHENLVHHYGIEIFNNILTVRKGLFSVCGYNSMIDNLNSIFEDIYKQEVDQIRKLSENVKNVALCELLHIKRTQILAVRSNLSHNKAISGTTYSILFPLEHAVLTENTATGEEPILYDSCKDDAYIANPIELSSIMKNVNTIQTDKKNIINQIAANIKSKFKHDQVTCLNMMSSQDNNTMIHYNCFEELIKGTILFALKQIDEYNLKLLPIAIINLTPFQLIEASRIISIYYAKESIKKTNDFNPFKKMPIYLKSNKKCNEIIFHGEDIEEVKRNIIKSAMINGTMFEELATVIELLSKESK